MCVLCGCQHAIASKHQAGLVGEWDKTLESQVLEWPEGWIGSWRDQRV